MRFFSKQQTLSLNAKLPPPPVSLQSAADPKETTIVYTGGALCLQRAKARFLEEEGPTYLNVVYVPGMRSDLSPGQGLIGVNKVLVIGKSFQDAMELLQSARFPCVLDFTPPPSPIVVSEVLGPARLLGVWKGMVLRAVNGSSMIEAKLSDVGSALHGANESSPA